MKRPATVLEWTVRGVMLLGGVSAFVYTANTDTSQVSSAVGGAALILGLYFGLTDWTTVRTHLRARTKRRDP